MTMLTLTKQRAALHYVFAAVIFSIYGGRVCPFIESISIWQTTAYSFITFAAMYVARTRLIQDRVGFKNVLLELGIFIAGALALYCLV